MQNEAQPNDQSSPANLPALLPPIALLLQRTQTTLGLLRNVVQESSAEYWYEQGKKSSAVEEWVEAAYAFEQCVRINAGYCPGFHQLAITLTQLGRTEKALTCYNHIIQLKPDVAWLYEERAKFKITVHGDYAGAIADLDASISLQPNSYWTLYDRAMLKEETEYSDGAIEDFTRIIKIFPEFILAYRERASIKEKIGDKTGALADREMTERLRYRGA